ncbi:hypothetical protein LCGC14_1086940 [marine sediment metagenome]|uniref:Uncharacterized protein n=1 Tax=marine sediment metagenome TaxID=412755 RepID=A0A0F9N166_9ZZZZ
MAEIVKDGDKSEYNIIKIGDVEANVLIGGKDSAVGFKVVSNVNISWECFSGTERFYINLNRKNVVVNTEKEGFSNGELSLAIGDNTDIWNVDGKKFNWDVKFDIKPASNKIEWDLQYSPGIKFNYQDTLENNYKNFSSGYATLEDYLQDHHRPENVVGSYVIRSPLRNRVKDQNGKTIYDGMGGNLGHIYRPKCIDDNGQETWCEVNITNNTLSITIPQTFLDNAQYPILLDPTFGITAEGGSTRTYYDDYLALSGPFTAPENGTMDSIACFGTNSASGQDIKAGVYNDDGGPTTMIDGETESVSVGTWTNDWSPEFTCSGTIVNGSGYWGALNVNDNFTIDYAEGNPGNWEYVGLPYANAFPDPYSGGPPGTYIYTYRLTYTAVGGGSLGAVLLMDHFNGGFLNG